MRKSIQIGLVGATVAACGFGLVGTANADVQPRTTDIVGVGSDTVQYLGDFLADGDNAGSSGYNTANPARRMFNIDATADAAGRAVYGAAGVSISPQVVLRAGLSPVPTARAPASVQSPPTLCTRSTSSAPHACRRPRSWVSPWRTPRPAPAPLP